MGEIWDLLTNTEVVHVPADMFDEAIAQAQIAGWKLLWINGYRNSARLHWAGRSGSLLGKTNRYLKIKIK